MIIKKPDVDAQGIYNRTQAAKALHVDRHTLARYERQGRIEFSVRGNARVTTGTEIVRCWSGLYEIK